MPIEYDDTIRYAARSLIHHRATVARLLEERGPGGWGAPAMRHGHRLQDWISAQRAGVHRLASGTTGGRVICTCGLIVPEDPRETDQWIPFFARLAHLDSETDRPALRFLVHGGPFDHWLWCVFCGPVEQPARDIYGMVDRDALEAMIEHHVEHRCPVG